MMMPEVSGIQATQQIREAGYAGPILVFSADTSRRTATRAIDAGANHYFVKTAFNLDLARALIEKFCFLKLP
jgi:DNA-binding NarL/FixJ family response regulator